MKRLIYYLGLILAITSCNFEKNLDIELPPHAKQMVVECYLEAGKPMRMLLSESSSYFDTLAETTIKRATVVISNGKRSDTLKYSPLYDIVNSKLYNFRNLKNLIPDTQALYSVEITDGIGRKITGATRFLPPPIIDSIRLAFRDEDTAASLRVWIKDVPQIANYYRVIVNVDSTNGSSNLDRTFSDELFDGKSFPIGTNFRYKIEDTLYIRVFNVEKPYYTFLESVEDAQRSNGNPFTQPASAKATVQGGQGVFTALSYTKQTFIVRK